jgi:MFS family permease
VTGEERVTYRAVLANREFAAILFSQTLSTAGDQLARIAIAFLVFQRTGSGLAASATYAVSYLTYLLAGPLLSAISDRRPRLSVMVISDLLRVPVVLALCIDRLPLVVLFACLTFLGLVSPAFDSARSATQPEILKGDAYVTGNAIMNIVLQIGQVVGFVLGGALVALVSVQGALALDAATFLISAGVLLACVCHRPAALAGTESSSLFRDTLGGLRFVADSPILQRYLAYSLLGSAALITPEGLAVPAAQSLGGGALAAGILTATIPAGFVMSGVLVLRIAPERRLDLLFPLALVAVVPLALSPLASSLPVLTALWTVAGLGACLNLIASAAYIQACPSEFRSRAYGVAATILFGAQGAALLLSGWLSDALDPRTAVACCGSAALLILILHPRLRPKRAPRTQEISQSLRSTQG